MANRPGLIIVSGRAQQISDADVLGAGGLDRITSGILKIGDATATDVALGRASGTVTIYGAVTGNVGFVQAANHTIAVNPSLSAGVAGGDMSLLAGTGNTTGAGGTLTLAAGDGGTSSGSGGGAELLGGDGGATNGAGGYVIVRGGVGSGTGTGGSVFVRGGTAASTVGAVFIGDTSTLGVYLGAASISTSVLGALTVAGNTTLGDNAAADATTFNSRIASSFVPKTHSAYDIGDGTTPLRWKKLWTVDADISGTLTLASLTLSGDLIVNGNTTLGSDSADTITVNGYITTGTVWFQNNSAHGIQIQAVASGTGQELQIGAGGSSSGSGGRLVLAGGAGTTTGQGVLIMGSSGVAGPILIGPNSTYTSSITLGGTGVTTTVSGDLNANGNTTLGDNATADATTFNSRIASAIVPKTHNAYDLGDGGTPLRWKKLWTVDADISGTLTMASLTLSGDLIVNGNTTLGSDSADTITINAYISTANVYFTNTTNHNLRVANVASGAGRSMSVLAGGSSSGQSGWLYLSGGTATTNGGGVEIIGCASGASGEVDIGTLNTTQVLIGSTSTIPTTVRGSLTIGTTSTDTITFNGYISSANVYFTNATGHNLRVANVASGAGQSMSVLAGGSSSGASGWLYLSGGTATSDGGGVEIIGCASGASGAVNIGTMLTTVVTIGASSIGTTVAGALTVLGDTTLGNNAVDQITFNGYINSDIVFRNAGASRNIRMDAAASGTGNDLTVQAQGTLSGAAGWLYLFGGVGTSTGGGVSVDSSSSSPGGTVRIGTSFGVGYSTSIIIGKDATTTTTINGTINIGIFSPGSVNIGATGVTTTIYGTLSLANALPITSGGTGATTKSSAFDNLAPSTSIGDLIVYDGIDNVRLGVSANDGFVVSASAAAALKVAYLDPQPTYVTPPGLCLANLTSTITMVNTRLAFVYLGRLQRAVSSVVLAYNVTTAQSGGTARLAVFTSPNPPVFQSVNPMTYRGEVDTGLTWGSTGRKTSTISVSGCTPGLHLWIGWYSGSSPVILPAFRAAQTDDAWSGIVQYKDGTAPSLWVAGSYPTASLYNATPPWFVAEFNQP